MGFIGFLWGMWRDAWLRNLRLATPPRTTRYRHGVVETSQSITWSEVYHLADFIWKVSALAVPYIVNRPPTRLRSPKLIFGRHGVLASSE